MIIMGPLKVWCWLPVDFDYHINADIFTFKQEQKIIKSDRRKTTWIVAFESTRPLCGSTDEN